MSSFLNKIKEENKKMKSKLPFTPYQFNNNILKVDDEEMQEQDGDEDEEMSGDEENKDNIAE